MKPETKPIKITLFHAPWCSHCVEFLPKWEELKHMPNIEKRIEFKNYDESAIKDLDKQETLINGKEFEGYPTIKIEILGKQFNYMNKREVDDILDFIKTKLQKIIKGENVDESSISDNVSDSPQSGLSASRIDSNKTNSESDNMLKQIKQDIEKSIENTTNKQNIMEGGGDIDNSRYAKRLDKKVLNVEKANQISEIII
jgi:thiol-disulfide isomerase/thioredoxin